MTHQEIQQLKLLCNNPSLLSIEYAAETAVLWIVKTCYAVDDVNCMVSIGVPGTIDKGVDNIIFLAELNVVALSVKL